MPPANRVEPKPDGGKLLLCSADAAGSLTGYYQGWDFGASDEGVSFGRHVISTGEDHFVRQITNSLSSSNSGPAVGPVAIQ